MANPANLIVNACVANGSIAQPAAQTIDTAGTVPMPAGHSMDRMIIEVVNSAAQNCDVVLKAGTRPPSLLAADMTTTVVATTGKAIIGPFESGRFVQADGTVNVQFNPVSGSPNLAIRVYKLPKQI